MKSPFSGHHVIHRRKVLSIARNQGSCAKLNLLISGIGFAISDRERALCLQNNRTKWALDLSPIIRDVPVQ